MDYSNIKKYLGEQWLAKQLENIEKKDLIKKGIPKNQINKDIIFSFLEKIDEILIKFKNIKNFPKWVEEAKTSKNFEDCLFELMALENLLLKSDLVELKPSNPISGFVLEALIKKDNKTLFIEMTKINSLRGSYKNKVEKLFGKVRDKFRGSQGIHFIGVFDLFKYEGIKDIPSKEFIQLQNTIERRFNFRENKPIQAFILTNIFLVYNPKLNKTFVQKRYYILNKPENKGGLPISFFKNIFDIDEFKIM